MILLLQLQDYTERKHGYGVVRELVGHGLGRSLHEDPQVPNYGKRGSGSKLKENMTLAIEPMINMGKKRSGYTKDEAFCAFRTMAGLYCQNQLLTANLRCILNMMFVCTKRKRKGIADTF